MRREGRRGKRWGGRARLEEMPSGKQDDDVSSNANADNKVTYDDEGDKDDGNDDDDGDNEIDDDDDTDDDMADSAYFHDKFLQIMVKRFGETKWLKTLQKSAMTEEEQTIRQGMKYFCCCRCCFRCR